MKIDAAPTIDAQPARGPVTPRSSPPSRVNPLFVWHALRRRARWFLLACIPVVLVAILFLATATPRYQATASVQIEQRPGDIGDLRDSVTGAPSDSNAVDTEVQVLSSRYLAAMVAQRLDLAKDPEFGGHAGAERARDADAVPNQVVDALMGHIGVRRTGLTYVVGISATSVNAEKASRIANAYAQTYVSSELDAKTLATRSATERLQQQGAQLRSQVQAADQAVQQYKISNGLLSAEGATMAEQEVSTLNQQIAIAKADLAEKQARYNAALSQTRRGGGGADVGAALNSDTVRQLRAQESEISRRLAEYASRYGELHPTVQQAKGELADVERKIQSEIDRILSSQRADVDVAGQRLASLTGSAGGARGSLAANNSAQVGLLELQRKADANRAIYEAVLNRTKETSAQERLQRPDAHVLSGATTPTLPASPNVPLLIVFTALAAMAAGIGAVVITEILDGTLKSGTDVEHDLGVTYAGGVPELKSTLPRAERSGADPAQYAIAHPLSAYGEAYNSLRSFLFTSAYKVAPRVVAIASALPESGKTVTALCLARSVAANGKSVLLIDGDLRRRGLTRRLLTKPQAGVVEVINGTVTLDDAIVHEEATGMRFLPASLGGGGGSPFATPSFDALLAELRRRFDVVIIDTAPVLAIADTRDLAVRADAVLMLARWRKVTAKPVNAALDILTDAGANIAGVALTRLDIRKRAFFSDSDRYHYYRAYEAYYANA